jgi:hypothetical protein
LPEEAIFMLFNFLYSQSIVYFPMLFMTVGQFLEVLSTISNPARSKHLYKPIHMNELGSFSVSVLYALCSAQYGHF